MLMVLMKTALDTGEHDHDTMRRFQRLQGDALFLLAMKAEEDERYTEWLLVWLDILDLVETSNEIELFPQRRQNALRACVALHQKTKVDAFTRDEIIAHAATATILIDRLLEIAYRTSYLEGPDSKEAINADEEIPELLSYRYSNDFALMIEDCDFESQNDRVEFYLRKTREVFSNVPPNHPARINTLRQFIQGFETTSRHLEQLERVRKEVQGMPENPEIAKLQLELKCYRAAVAHTHILSPTDKLLMWKAICEKHQFKPVLSSWETEDARRHAKPLCDLLSPSIYSRCRHEIRIVHAHAACWVLHSLMFNHIIWDIDEFLTTLWGFECELVAQNLVPSITKSLFGEVSFDLAIRYLQAYASAPYYVNMYPVTHTERVRTLLKFYWRLTVTEFGEKERQVQCLKAELLGEKVHPVQPEDLEAIDYALGHLDQKMILVKMAQKDAAKGDFIKEQTKYTALLNEKQPIVNDQDFQLLRNSVHPLRRRVVDFESLPPEIIKQYSSLAIGNIDKLLVLAHAKDIPELLRFRNENEEELLRPEFCSRDTASEYFHHARKAFARFEPIHPTRLQTLKRYANVLEDSKMREEAHAEIEREASDAWLREYRDVRVHKSRSHTSYILKELRDSRNHIWKKNKTIGITQVALGEFSRGFVAQNQF